MSFSLSSNFFGNARGITFADGGGVTWTFNSNTNTVSAGAVTGLVAALPAATLGAKAFVTDANSTTFASIVAGGGANKVPVYSDGTNWRIG